MREKGLQSRWKNIKRRRGTNDAGSREIAGVPEEDAREYQMTGRL
jgi:hypothetical protein